MDRNKCVGCAKLSPEVESEFTLVGPQVGWRISRTQSDDGLYVIEWRCPDCWKRFREQKASPSKGAGVFGSMPPTPPKPAPRGGR